MTESLLYFLCRVATGTVAQLACTVEWILSSRFRGMLVSFAICRISAENKAFSMKMYCSFTILYINVLIGYSDLLFSFLKSLDIDFIVPTSEVVQDVEASQCTNPGYSTLL